MSKPDLSLYLGRKVVGVVRGDEAKDWGIELEKGVKILNKHKLETIPPTEEIIGCTFYFISMSLRDTTLHFKAANMHIHKISFPPTFYVIADPVHGGEVYPQWDEDLEEMGVAATPDGGISDKPSKEWPEEQQRLLLQQQATRESNAQEFLQEDK